jgi:hypothetical protein
MKPRKILIALSIALQLAPLGVHATTEEAVPAPTSGGNRTLLSLERVTGAVRNFSAERTGTENQVRLYGRIFQDCASHLEIRLQSPAPTGVLGVEIIDKGEFVACQQRHSSETCTSLSGRSNTCVSLSALPGATIPVGDRDVVVQLHSHNADSDRDSDVLEDFPTRLTFESSRTRRQRAAAEQARIRTERIAQARGQVNSCRRNAEELSIARGALSFLRGIGAEDEAGIARLEKQLDRRELDLLKAQVRRASLDDLSEIEESVVAIAERNCDVNDAAALTMREIALRYINHREAGLEGYDRARETLERTAELSCLSEANQARVQSYLTDLDVGRCQKISEAGITNNFLLGPCVANLTMNLQQRALQACSGSNASLESCSQAMAAVRSGQQITQRAHQVEQQRAQIMQQMQQTLAGIQAPGMLPNSTPANPGLAGQPLWAGGSFGLH